MLQDALRASIGSELPIELLAENAQIFKTYPVSYHDGEKSPHLERVAAESDFLTAIVMGRTR